MQLQFVTVDVFTEQRFGGNPLAVFPEASGLSDRDMQALAAEFNLSETTFVLPPTDPANTARVRIFNRTREMPFAGHPNVGTAYVLARLGLVHGDELRFEEIAGLVVVRLERGPDGAVIGATIDAPQPLALGVELAPAAIAECAGLAPADIVVTHHPPMHATVGNTYVIAEVSGEALTRAAPAPVAFRRVLAETPELQGRFSLYLYAHDGASLRARMFAPLAGTYEDAATGSAATPLAALLLSLTDAAEARYTIRQGVEMGRPSLLYTSAIRTPDGIRASVRGRCVPVLQGEATV
jgi:trans-2,3-dihydro-3-hydroxyanthranilate isomerase